MDGTQTTRTTGTRLGDARDVAELSDEYELLAELGRGGSAVVYHAVDRTLGREVAIKVVHPRPAAPGDDAVARLAREARTVAQLQHANIVTVYAVRRLRSGGLALVMQLVPGATLKSLVQREGPLPAERCERILRDVAQALRYAHARGVVHRDVKPENIFVDEESGRALLADFGIARSTEHDSMTLTGTAIGTPFYMSPEQVEGGALDGRSDLYSLGLVCWEMLTGRRPWDGESLYNVIWKQKHEELPPIDAFRTGVPLRLQYIVERMLQKRPAARWAGADGLMAQLDHAVLPADYGRWQAAHARRLDAWRAADRERRAAEAQEKPGRADRDSSTVRFPRRPRPTPSTAAAAVTAGGGLTIADLPTGADTMAFPRPMSPDAIDEAPEPTLRSEPIVVAVPAAEPAPVAYGDVAAPSWAATTEAEPSGVRPRRAWLIGAAAASALFVAAVLAWRTLAPFGGPRIGASGPDATPFATSPDAEPASTAPEPAAAVAGAATPPPAAEADRILGVGGRHACLLVLGGELLCWGANEAGQLGDATLVRRTTPVRVVGDLVFAQVSAGMTHSCAVTRVGDAYCWGNDGRGQLGDATTLRRPAPVRVAGREVWREVHAGGAHSCALDERGEVGCWGANDRGQLGDGSDVPARTTPTRVRLDGEPTVTLAVGINHSCAIDRAGTARCWGANGSGQLGDGTRGGERRLPVTVQADGPFVSVAPGAVHSCGITRAGAVLCWGRNDDGQLGTGDRTARERAAPVQLSASVRARRLAAGPSHTCVLSEDGSVWCWGANASGQLGVAGRSARLRPVRVPLGAAAAAVSAGAANTCALTTTGAALCWGSNVEGQLGDSTRVGGDRPRAVRIGALPSVATIPPGR